MEAKGVPLRAGWLVEWADMYAVSAPPTGPPSWNRCRSSGRKELLRSSGAAGVYPPLLCVCAPPHTPHSSPLLPVCHLMLPPQLTHPLDVLVCARANVNRGFLLREKWRLLYHLRYNDFGCCMKIKYDVSILLILPYFSIKIVGRQ